MCCSDLFFCVLLISAQIATLVRNSPSYPLILKESSGLFLTFLAVNIAFSQRKVELAFSRSVSQERLQQTVRDLVGFGNRQGGTRSGDKAAVYMLKEFTRMGLKTEILEDPEKLTFANDQWSIDVVQPAKLKGVFAHSWLAGFSPSSRQKRVRLVRVSPEGDLSNVDVDSAAVLVDLANAGRLYSRLAEKGAVCLITWSEPHSKAYTNSAFIENLPAGNSNPIPVFDISRTSVRALMKTLDSNREIRIAFSSKTRIKKGKSKTVVATLPGRSAKYYIVCAHGDSDSGGPGADDNASGDSGVLEIGRILSSMRRNGAIPLPDSSIRFIIWGSEYGSTENYVKTHSNELANIVGVLNFDEIGTGATRNCIYFEGNDQRVNYHLLKTLQKIGEDYVGKKSFWREATTNPSQGGTDSYVFLPIYLGRLGVPVVEIPSITVYTAAWQEPKSIFQPREWRTRAWKGPEDSVYIDYSLYYHSSMDTPSLTTDREPFNMGWGVKAVGIALLRLAWH
jgi:hypothetical protein